MFAFAKRRLIRLLLVLGMLVSGLGIIASNPTTKSADAACDPSAKLICCSACEADPPPRPCRAGCSPSC